MLLYNDFESNTQPTGRRDHAGSLAMFDCLGCHTRRGCDAEPLDPAGGVLCPAAGRNGPGPIAGDEWLRSAGAPTELRLDALVVMPNSIHGIVFMDASNGDPSGRKGDPPLAPTPVNGSRAHSLESFIAGHK